jgi:alkylation response protein AidB-like acyl-CoA dehydrogenase
VTAAGTDNTTALELLADFASSFTVRDAERVRALRDGGGGVDREMWRRIAEAGWLSILVPEELDGAGLGVDAAVIVGRRLGRGAFPEPFVSAGVLTPVALSASEADDSGEHLAGVLAGECLVGVAWDRGVSAGAGGVLNGESRFVGVAGADAFVVAAEGADGPELHWVEGGAAGLTVTPERLADGTASDRIRLDAVRAAPIVPAPRGGPVLERALDLARIVLAAELTGIADAALELTLDYLKARKQFGRPIGSFQALQHRAVDMWMERQLAAAALEAAVRAAVDSTTPRQLAIAASSAKARAAQAATSVCGSALQAHGAIGFTDEYDLGLYLNRALALAPWLGNAVESRRRWLALQEDDEE